MKFLFKDDQYTPLQACICALLSFFIFSSADVFAKWLIGRGFDNTFIITLTYMIGLIQLVIVMLAKGEFQATLQTANKKWHILRGLVLLVMTYFLLKTIASIPLAGFYSIIFSVPFLVTVCSVFFFGDKVGTKDWLAIAAGFIGVLIIINPGRDLTVDIGYLYAVATAIGVASAALIARRIGHRERIYPFAFFVFIVVIIGNIGFFDWAVLPTLTATEAAAFLAYGTILPLGTMLLSATYAKTPSIAYVAPFQYTRMVWGILFGLALFGEIPQTHVFTGSAIVIVCGLYVLLHARRK